MKYPEFQKNSQSEGQEIGAQLKLVDVVSKKNFSFPDSKRQVILFWATWCPPCKVELARINHLINLKKINPEQIVAISLDENESTVLAALEKTNYSFLVAHDAQSSLARSFKVEVTPTILLIDENNIIVWRTTGISPSLEARLLRFLN